MSKAGVVFLKEAFQDLDGIFDYISADSPKKALEMTDRILKHIDQLSEFPESDKIYPDGKLKDYCFRTIVEEPYLIFYRYIGEEAVIYRILHGARDILCAAASFDI